MGQSLFKGWAKRKEARILMNGLDAAGKTTILYKLKLGEVVTTIPTIGFNVETLDYRGIKITAWDVGGRGKIRPLYRHYYTNTDAILYVVDSNDKERLEEAKDEMQKMVAEDELKDAVVVILANKQDLPNAMSVAEVAKEMGFMDVVRSHRAAIFGCCATSGDGLYEALDFLSKELLSPSRKETPTDKHLEKSSSEKTAPWSFTAYVKETLKALLPRSSGH